MNTWLGVELKSAREALGMSQKELARALHNPVTDAQYRDTRISEAERGLRPVPDWLPEQITALEQARDSLAETALEMWELWEKTSDGEEDVPECVFIVHESNKTLWQAHPEMRDKIPAVVQRVATALAVAQIEEETGQRPRIVPWIPPSNISE